jgi:hypothetical protein
MNTKEQIEQCIKSLTWLKWNIVGDDEPEKNTFEYATKVYIDNAIAILKDSVKDTETLQTIKKNLVVMDARVTMSVDIFRNETDFRKIKEGIRNG